MHTAVEVEQMDENDVKIRSDDLLAAVGKEKIVSLIKDGEPVAYVISPALYGLLAATMEAKSSQLEGLARDFEKMIVRMQEPEHIEAVHRLMSIDTAALRDGLSQSATATTRKDS